MKSAAIRSAVCLIVLMSGARAQQGCSLPAPPTNASVLTLDVGYTTGDGCVTFKNNQVPSTLDPLMFRIAGTKVATGTWVILMVRAYTTNPTNATPSWFQPPTPYNLAPAYPGLPDVGVGSDVLATSVNSALSGMSETQVMLTYLPLLMPAGDPTNGYPVVMWTADPKCTSWIPSYQDWWNGLTACSDCGNVGGANGTKGVFTLYSLAQSAMTYQAAVANCALPDAWFDDPENEWAQVLANGEFQLTFQALGLQAMEEGDPDDWATWPTLKSDGTLDTSTNQLRGLVGWNGGMQPPDIKLSNPVPVTLLPRTISSATDEWFAYGMTFSPLIQQVHAGDWAFIHASGYLPPTTARLRYANGVSTSVLMHYGGYGKMKFLVPQNAVPGAAILNRFMNPVGISSFSAEGWNQLQILP